MRDFSWRDELYVVVKNDGTYAGVPCRSYEEARDLAAQHEDSEIYVMTHEDDVEGTEYEDDEDYDEEMGYDPYLGAYSYNV